MPLQHLWLIESSLLFAYPPNSRAAYEREEAWFSIMANLMLYLHGWWTSFKKVSRRGFHPEIGIAIVNPNNCCLCLERVSHFLIVHLYELYFHHEAFHNHFPSPLIHLPDFPRSILIYSVLFGFVCDNLSIFLCSFWLVWQLDWELPYWWHPLTSYDLFIA